MEKSNSKGGNTQGFKENKNSSEDTKHLTQPINQENADEMFNCKINSLYTIIDKDLWISA